MSENHKSLLIINDADDLPSESISLPLRWNGLDITYLSTASSSYPIHNHRAVQIIIPLLTSGFEAVTLSAFSSRQKSQKLTVENVIVTPAYQPHTLLWGQETELVMFDLEPEFIERAAGEAFRGSEVEIREEGGIRDSFITQLGSALYSEFKNPSAVGRLYIESLAVTLAVHLLRNYSATAQNVREFSGGLSGAKHRLAIEYIDSHLDQNLSLTNIAETVGMSPYYFSRALKNQPALLRTLTLFTKELSVPNNYLSKRNRRLLMLRWQSATSVTVISRRSFVNSLAFLRPPTAKNNLFRTPANLTKLIPKAQEQNNSLENRKPQPRRPAKIYRIRRIL